mgnify:CR=1 FL=1
MGEGDIILVQALPSAMRIEQALGDYAWGAPAPGDGDAVHYLYDLPDSEQATGDVAAKVTPIARSITHLGWGIDMAVGDATVISEKEAAQLRGVRWLPSPVGGTPLRVPRSGTLEDLIRKHQDFLDRLTKDGFRPVPPLRVFDIVRYRQQGQPPARPGGADAATAAGTAPPAAAKPDGAARAPPDGDTVHQGMPRAAVEDQSTAAAHRADVGAGQR